MKAAGKNEKKESWLEESIATAGGVTGGSGWEGGLSTRPSRPLPPSMEFFETPSSLSPIRSAAERLRSRLVAGLSLEPEEIAVHLSHARVSQRISGGCPGKILAREILTARVDLGSEGGGYRPWSRLAPLDRLDSEWPPGWVEALARETDSWPGTGRPGIEERPRGGPVVLDVFAVADLLRLMAARWMGLPLARRVAAPTVRVEDPGFFHSAAGGDADGAGAPALAYAVVEKGILVGRPGDGERGSRVQESWRREARPGWRWLRLSAAPSLDLTARRDQAGWWITRLVWVRGLLLGAGHWREGPEASRPFGLVPLRPPSFGLERVIASIPPGVADASGFPVTVPALLIDGDPFD